MKPGIIMAGRFLLERQAGSGGMGAVFRAQDRLDGTTVALKILHSRQPLDVERFEREAGILADFAHPGIVRYVGHGLTPEGDHWLAMEWLEGEDLSERLQRAPLSGAETLTLAARAADVLAFAHAKGLVHRDIKPSNIFLVGKQVDRIKLVDFGIARPSSHTRRLTQTGVLLGTPGYIAPELVQGPPSHDPRSDLFSLGCVLFECLTGLPAFEGTHPMAVLAKLLLQEAPRVRQHRADVPEAVDALVGRMMAREPEGRPDGAGEVAKELARLHDLGGWGAAPRRSVPPTGAAPTERVLYDASAPVSSPAPSEDEPAPASLTMSEKRLVSVVLAGDPDADESAPGPRLPVDELRKAVANLGGQVNVLAGDSLIVTLWGPGSAVDRAERAAQCATILRANLPGVPVCITSGRGLVAARIVEGSVIDRGVRTLRTTRPGPIHLDDVTAGMLTGRLLVEQDHGHYVLRAQSSELDGPPLLLGKPTSCVGRTREIATLEGVFAGCVSERVASPVLVVGPAGSGKSRLGRELLRGGLLGRHLGDGRAYCAYRAFRDHGTADGDASRAGRAGLDGFANGFCRRLRRRPGGRLPGRGLDGGLRRRASGGRPCGGRHGGLLRRRGNASGRLRGGSGAGGLGLLGCGSAHARVSPSACDRHGGGSLGFSPQVSHRLRSAVERVTVAGPGVTANQGEIGPLHGPPAPGGAP